MPMSASRGGDATPAWSRAGGGRGEAGVVMMFVLMAILLIGAVTLSVMQILTADVAGGVEELEADQVFNVAQAGVHYAIGQLQLSGANTYAGQTITIASGSTTLGTAAMTVNCIDTGKAPPCGGTYAGYRRIVSVGTLPVPGPTRTLVAVVQATQGNGPYAVCGTAAVDIDEPVTVYSDVGSNGTIHVMSGGGTAHILGDPNTPQQYTGKAVAASTITCDAGCATQVAGGIYPNTPGPVCPAVTLPPFPDLSGFPDKQVTAAGWTMDSSTGYTWRNINVDGGAGGGAKPYNDFKIQADPVDPNATTVVNINTLNMKAWTRLVILGVGKIDLRIGQSTGQSLYVDASSRFGVTTADTQGSPATVPASRLIVSVNSSAGAAGCNTCSAAWFNGTSNSAGTFYVTNGGMAVDQLAAPFTGYIIAKYVVFHNTLTFGWDPAVIPVSTYTNFNNLRSWKDQ